MELYLETTQSPELLRPQWSHDLGLRLLIWIGNVFCPTDTQSLMLLQRFEAMSLMKLPWIERSAPRFT